MMVVAITEAEAEQEVGQATEGNEAIAGPVGTLAIRGTDVAKVPSVETQVALIEGNAMGAPTEDETRVVKGAPAGEDEAAEVS